MLGTGRIGGWAAGLLALGLAAAPPAQAQRMYTGSWVAESFGNDVVGGADESEFFSVVGIPRGNQCNPLQPRCPFQSTPVDGGGAISPLGPTCTPVSNVGGGVRPAKGATATSMGHQLPTAPRYRNPAFFTASGLPNTTSCTAYTTANGSPATTFLTTDDPARGIVMKGAPLMGGGTAATTVGGAFQLAAGDMRRTTVGEFNIAFPYLYAYTYATLSNDAGTFGPGGGPGGFSILYGTGTATAASIIVKQGANRFGGTMKLMGALRSKVCYFRNGGCLLGSNDWRYDAIGAEAYTSGGVVTRGYRAPYAAKYHHTTLMQTSTVSVSGARFPWTTGSATVAVARPYRHATVERRKGFDSRTAGGAGRVQLVSPTLTRWLQPGNDFETGGIAILKLEFVPEPGVWAMLAGGLSLLGVLYRVRGR